LDLLNRVINKLKQLDTDSEGYIRQSAANRKIIAEAGALFDPLETDYNQGISKYLGAIPALDAENDAYFDLLSSAFKPNAQFGASLKKQVISDLEGLLLNEGLESQIKTPLLSILNQNVNSSAKFADLVKEVQNYIVGSPDAEGKLLRYSKQITQDSLFNYSRAYQQAISSDLGLDHYLYAGGITEGGRYSSGSRPFCMSRVGNTYTLKQIEQWASYDWAGKRAGTTASSIFIYCGGYSCRHSLIPVKKPSE
jgi:hypothetical protein